MDHPFYEVAASAEDVIDRGGIVFQKWTCSRCEQRLTMEIPNTFHKIGYCFECGAESDIVAQGCNFVAVFDRQDQRYIRPYEVGDPRD